jgi:hypothetical protein
MKKTLLILIMTTSCIAEGPPASILMVPVAAEGYGVSPGGRLKILFDPPLYRDAIFASLPRDRVTVQFVVEDVPEDHP